MPAYQKRDSEKALAAAIDAITASLQAGEKVQLVGFGIFDVKERAARTAATPKQRKLLKFPLPEHLSLKPEKLLRTQLPNNPFIRLHYLQLVNTTHFLL